MIKFDKILEKNNNFTKNAASSNTNDAYKIYSDNKNPFLNKLEIILIGDGEITSPELYDDVLEYWSTIKALNQGDKAIVALNKAVPKYDSNKNLVKDKDGKIQYDRILGQQNATDAEFGAATKTHTHTTHYKHQDIFGLRDQVLNYHQASKNNRKYGLTYDSKNNYFRVRIDENDKELKLNRINSFVNASNALLTELYDSGYINTLIKFYNNEPQKFPKILKSELDTIKSGLNLRFTKYLDINDDEPEIRPRILTNFEQPPKNATEEQLVTFHVMHLISVAYGVINTEDISPSEVVSNGTPLMLSFDELIKTTRDFKQYIENYIIKLSSNPEEIYRFVDEIGARKSMHAVLGSPKFSILNRTLLSLYSMIDNREYYRVASASDWRRNGYTIKGKDAKPLFLVRPDVGNDQEYAYTKDEKYKPALDYYTKKAGFESYSTLRSKYNSNPTEKMGNLIKSIQGSAVNYLKHLNKTGDYTLYPVFDERDVVSIKDETRGKTAYEIARTGGEELSQGVVYKKLKNSLNPDVNKENENQPAIAFYNYIKEIAQSFNIPVSGIAPDTLEYSDLVIESKNYLKGIVSKLLQKDFRLTQKKNTAKERLGNIISDITSGSDSLINPRSELVSQFIIQSYGLPNEKDVLYTLAGYINRLPTAKFKYNEAKEVIPQLVYNISRYLRYLKTSATNDKKQTSPEYITNQLNEIFEKYSIRLTEDMIPNNEEIPVPDESLVEPEYIVHLLDTVLNNNDNLEEQTNKLFEAIINVL
jgi:hypothetical protein